MLPLEAHKMSKLLTQRNLKKQIGLATQQKLLCYPLLGIPMIYVQLVTQLHYMESLQTEFTLLSKGGGVMEQTRLLPSNSHSLPTNEEVIITNHALHIFKESF